MFNKLKQTIADTIGSNHEVPDSVREALVDRVTSPFYGYFILSWVIVNWDYLYTALFIGSDELYKKYGLLRNEYLLQQILPNHYVSLMYWWNFILYPLIITAFVFWVMPILTNPFYIKYLRNKVHLEVIKNRELVKEVQSETALIYAEANQAEAAKKASRVSPEIVWKREFAEFIKSYTFKGQFQEILNAVYKHSGDVRVLSDFGAIEFEVSSEALSYADLNSLITIDNNSGKIELTEKGKYFARRFIKDKDDEF